MRLITLKRVPLGFDWPLGTLWFGYFYDPITCEMCVGIGNVNWPDEENPEQKVTMPCPVCNGKGKVTPIIEVPKGKGYQIWETMNYMTEEHEHYYYPVSPVFKDPFKLAEWMKDRYIINNDPLLSESDWYDAIKDDNVDTVFGLYRDNIECKDIK